MKKKPFIACFLFFLTNSCFLDNNQGNPTAFQETGHSFPDTFIEKGSDADTSYFSLRVINRPDSLLQLDCTGWGIEETGMLLLGNRADSIYTVLLGARCGSVPTWTWVKATFSQNLSMAQVDSISKILYINTTDTIAIPRAR